MTLNLKDPTLLRQQCYIDGQWLDARSGGSKPVTNPATGAVLGTVPFMGADETRAAIEAAAAAFPGHGDNDRHVQHRHLGDDTMDASGAVWKLIWNSARS